MKGTVVFNVALLTLVIVACHTVLVQQTPQPFIGHAQGNAYGMANPWIPPTFPAQPMLIVRSSVAPTNDVICLTNLQTGATRCFTITNSPHFQNLVWKFAPTTFTNLTAFVQTRASLTDAWTMLWQAHYPPNGGTFTFPVPTNGRGWMRAGYGVP